MAIKDRNWFTKLNREAPVWDPLLSVLLFKIWRNMGSLEKCYTLCMSLRSSDESLLANLSSRHLFRGMLHEYEFILSRVISRTILRCAPCTHDDYLLNTSHLLDCSYLLSANPFAKKSHLKKGWKATASGSHLFHSKFWYLPPPLGVGRNGEGVGKGKKEKYWEGGYPRMAGKKLSDSFKWF